MSHLGDTISDSSPRQPSARNISTATKSDDDVSVRRAPIKPFFLAESFVTPAKGSSALPVLQETKMCCTSTSPSRQRLTGSRLCLISEGVTQPPMIPEIIDTLAPCPRVPLMPRNMPIQETAIRSTVHDCPCSTPSQSYLPANVQSSHVAQAPNEKCNISLMDIGDGDSSTPLPYLNVFSSNTVEPKPISLAMKSSATVLPCKSDSRNDIIFYSHQRHNFICGETRVISPRG